MVLIFEVTRPLHRPGHYRGRVMARAWWLWFAVGYLRVPFHEFAQHAYTWEWQ